MEDGGRRLLSGSVGDVREVVHQAQVFPHVFFYSCGVCLDSFLF